MSSPVKSALICVFVLLCLSISRARAQRRLCGRLLADTLDFVCEGRGFHLGKRSVDAATMRDDLNKRSSLPDLDFRQPSPNEDSKKSENVVDAAQTDSTSSPVQVGGKNSGFRSWLNSERGTESVDNAYNSAADADGNKNDNQQTSQAHSLRRRETQEQRTVVDECCRNACSLRTLQSYCASTGDPEEDIATDLLRQRFGMQSPTPRYAAQRQGRLPLRRPSAEISRGSGNPANNYFWVNLGRQATRSPLIE